MQPRLAGWTCAFASTTPAGRCRVLAFTGPSPELLGNCSMGGQIGAVKTGLLYIIDGIEKSTLAQQGQLRIAVVAYRDALDADPVVVSDFTADTDVTKRAVDLMSASGGGDRPEGVAVAFHAVSGLEWRPSAARSMVLIADAPPHGAIGLLRALTAHTQTHTNSCTPTHTTYALCSGVPQVAGWPFVEQRIVWCTYVVDSLSLLRLQELRTAYSRARGAGRPSWRF